MNSTTVQKIARYALVRVIVLSLLLLLWWYFFLERTTSREQAIDAARGLNTGVPEFSAPEGSTYLNLVRSLPSKPLWQSVQDAVETATHSFVFSKDDTNEGGRARLWKASALPSAGAGFVVEGSTTTLRFVERATGNLLSGDLSARLVSRLTNTLVPKVEEAFFSGERVFLRTSEGGVVTTKTALVLRGDEPQPLVQTDLEERILSLASSPRGDTIAYIVSDRDGGVLLMTRSADWKNEKRITTLGTRDWNVMYGGDRIIVTERASDDVGGYAYEVGPKGELIPLVRNAPGLVVRPHASSSAFLWSTSREGVRSLFIQKSVASVPLTEQGVMRGAPVLLPLKTVAEKCAFAPSGLVAYCAVPRKEAGEEFIDRWYRGEAHTNDVWWEIDTEHATAKEFFDPTLESDVSIDAEIPLVSDDGAYLVFRNAQDWSLWVLSLR